MSIFIGHDNKLFRKICTKKNIKWIKRCTAFMNVKQFSSYLLFDNIKVTKVNKYTFKQPKSNTMQISPQKSSVSVLHATMTLIWQQVREMIS